MTGIALFNYFAALFFFLFGIFVMIAARNLLRKVIGMSIMQTGVILFFISLAFKDGARIPILSDTTQQAIDPQHYINPLPHALMLTAIVVGVSLLGVALVLIVKIYRETGSLEEDDILKKVESPS